MLGIVINTKRGRNAIVFKDKHEHLIFPNRWFYSIISSVWLSNVGKYSVYDQLLKEVTFELP